MFISPFGASKIGKLCCFRSWQICPAQRVAHILCFGIEVTGVAGAAGAAGLAGVAGAAGARRPEAFGRRPKAAGSRPRPEAGARRPRNPEISIFETQKWL
jgi:hypothetical protein